MKWSRSDYEAMIGLRKEKKKKKRQKKKPTSGALHATKALLHSMILAKLLGRDNKNAQQKRAIAAMLSKSDMNGMGRMWKKILNSKYPLPKKQIKQLIRDKKLIDSFFDTRILLDMRRRIVAHQGGFLGLLLPLITKVAVPLVGSVAHKLFGEVAIVGEAGNMSYRISYLVPKKEFKCLLLGKNSHEQYRKPPPKNCPLLAGRRNPRKHRPHPEGMQN